MSAPVFSRATPDDGHLSFTRNPVAELQGEPVLLVTLQKNPVAIARLLTRDDVQELVQALDDWLYDSRPA